MKRARLIDLLTTIQSTIVSFVSIAIFVALAVAVFLGIGWSGEALKHAAQTEFSSNSLHDIEIQFPYGLTKSDLDELRAVEGVTDVEGSQVTYQFVGYADKTYVTRISSCTSRIDTLTVVSGNLPSAEGEVALEANAAKDAGIDIGDSLHVNVSDGEEYLTTNDFTVTALVECPSDISSQSSTWGSASIGDGVIDLLAWVPISTFSSEAFHDGSAVVKVCSDSLRMADEFSDEYVSKSKELQSRIEELGSRLASARHQSLYDDAQAKVDEGQQALDDAYAQIEDGERAIEEADAKLASGRQSLSDGEAQLASAKSQYASKKSSGRAELDEAAEKLDAGWGEYESKLNEYNEGCSARDELVAYVSDLEARISPSDPDYEEELLELAALTAMLSEMDEELAAASAQLESARAELEEKERQYQAGEAEYASQLSAAESKIASSTASLESGRAELAQGQTELDEKKAELEDAKSQIAEKESDLSFAKEKLQDLKDADYDWVVLTRSANGGIISIREYVDVVGRLRISMALLFVFVGLFVCYSAISRLVLETTRQIGVKKAMGMTSREITAMIIMYAVFSVALGVTMGIAFAALIVEKIVLPTLTSSFYISARIWWSPWGATLFGLVELALIVLSAWVACRFVLKHDAVNLLNDSLHRRTSRLSILLRKVIGKLPIYTQISVNNLLHDSRRVLGTIVGVAGCTALVVCAVTLNNNVGAGVGIQYRDIYHFNDIITVDTTQEKALQSVQQQVINAGCSTTVPVLRQGIVISLPDDSSSSASVLVPTDVAAFNDVVTLISTDGDTKGQHVELESGGAWVSCSYQEHYGAKVGDTLSVVSSDGYSYDVPIAGFFRHYLLGFQIVMSADTYESLIGEEAAPNALLAQVDDASQDAVKALERDDCVFSVMDDKGSQQEQFDTFRQVSRIVVLVYLALSIAMSIVVLLNLNIMFVEEKKRDLITLMVCGYSLGDAKRYIWRDNVLLTIIGIVFGVALGVVTGVMSVIATEVSYVSLVKTPDLVACVCGIAVSSILSAVMTIVALRRVGTLQLSDINRT
ncbi:MAG: FtsX-like permease family protein [Eggerthellaceae bacterium]|nr:FtsX-like permease family protein [Eggerthellaceae bacterium]